MSARRHNQAELVCVWNDLVNTWNEESAESEESILETGVFARRQPRDSYTQERALLKASWDMHGEDLIEVSASDDESQRVHFLPTVRP